MSSNFEFLPWPHRTLVEIAGPDAKSFLHRFCTNDIDRLGTGEGCEAFITTVQGKTLSHVIVTVDGESVVLETVAEQASVLMPHLDRYLFNEKAELIDRSDAWSQTLLLGAEWQQHLSQLPTRLYGSTAVELDMSTASVVAVPFTNAPCYLLRCEADAAAGIHAALKKFGGQLCSPERFEYLRIEAGYPMFGVDFDDKNLPQEVDRNPQAISFTKGCYLGQETVARLDALGHVNKILTVLEFSGGVEIELGSEVACEDRVVGKLTSAARQAESLLGLAIIRETASKPGTSISVNGTPGVVRALSAQDATD